MATRIKLLKDKLEKTVMDPDWKKFKVNGRTPIELKARDVKDLLVSDGWWDQLDYLHEFTLPMMNFLRAADTNSSVLHLVYDMWDTMIEEIFWNQRVCQTLIILAHSLVPKYYTQEWIQGASNNIQRVAPNEDEEISLNRNSCLQRLFPNPEDARRVFLEYGAFSGSLGYFAEPHVTAARTYEDPLSWWSNYGSTAPLLRSLAFKLLSQHASSSCCERNWSTYGGIQTIKRNKLNTKRLEDLVYIHNNLRLLSRKMNEYTNGPCKFWDIGGDNIDGDSILEVVELSLNEPEIEAISFDI